MSPSKFLSPLIRCADNALRHGRLLFLRAVSHNLEHQSQAGALRWNSAKFLGHMVEALEDTVSHSQEKWFDEVRSPCPSFSPSSFFPD